jgi:thiol:disulfide interchange protein DsbD
VKSLLGLLMVVVALYFLGNAFPSVVRGISRSAVFVVTASLAVVVGLLLGAVQRDLAQSTWPGKLAKLVGVLLVSLGVFTLVTVWLKPTQSIAWLQVPVAEARARALAEKRPMLIDFTAAWCIACKELDKHTFSDRAVIDESERFIAVKVDATNDDEPEAAGAQRDYQVRGLPTVILVDSRGREAKRYTDFIPASTLLPALRAVD